MVWEQEYNALDPQMVSSYELVHQRQGVIFLPLSMALPDSEK